MKTTTNDLKKYAGKSWELAKGAVYWGYLPVLLFLGFKTIDWDRLKTQ
jgi:hypothetical protein